MIACVGHTTTQAGSRLASTRCAQKLHLAAVLRIGIDVKRVVRAGLHAGFASDAAAVIEINDAIVALEERAGRTNLDAWRLLAMVAAHHAEMAAGVGKGAFLDVLDPGAEDANRDFMLILAGDRARMASDASVLVDHEAVTHLFDCPANCSEPREISPLRLYRGGIP